MNNINAEFKVSFWGTIRAISCSCKMRILCDAGFIAIENHQTIWLMKLCFFAFASETKWSSSSPCLTGACKVSISL